MPSYLKTKQNNKQQTFKRINAALEFKGLSINSARDERLILMCYIIYVYIQTHSIYHTYNIISVYVYVIVVQISTALKQSEHTVAN